METGGGGKLIQMSLPGSATFSWKGDSPDELHLTTASISVGLFWDLRLICASLTAVLSVE